MVPTMLELKNIMNINNKHRYKIKPTDTKPNNPIPGCVYRGDAGNGEWFTGMLLRHDEDYSIIRDARGIERVIISSTLRSSQSSD